MKSQWNNKSDIRNSLRREQAQSSNREQRGLDHGTESLVAKDNPDDSQLGAGRTNPFESKAP